MTTLGELLYALVEPVPEDAGEVYSIVAGGSLFELYGMPGHDDCGLSQYCRNPLHPGPCKGWKKHLGLTAPGVLSALEKAQKEKLAISRAKRAAAKAEAEKITHKALGHSAHPLHSKQLTVKHAKTILTGDEGKATAQASKVILNKTEIKRYAKLKSAQIAANGGAWAGVADQGAFAKQLEQHIANALALDNKEGSTHHLTDLLGDTSTALAAQFANRSMPGCAKGDHDCDGLAFEGLKEHLSTSVFRGLRDGNMDEANRQAEEVKALGGDSGKIRDWLKKEGVDLEPPEMQVEEPTPPPAKVGAPQYGTLKQVGLKPGDKVYLHAVSHDGKKHAATTSDVKGANTHTVLVTVDAPSGGKAVFHDDATGEKIAGGTAAKKYFMTQAEGHPLTQPEPIKPKKAVGPPKLSDSKYTPGKVNPPVGSQKAKTAAKVNQQLNAPDTLGDKLDQAFGPPPKVTKGDTAMSVLSDKQLVAGIKMHGSTSAKGQVIAAELAKRGLDLDGNPLDKPNDLTPDEAAPAVPKAAEWTQPGKFDGWLPSQEVKKVIVGAKTPSTDAEAAQWVATVEKIPKSQFDNLVPSAQDAILKGLADEHEMAMGNGALDSADHLEDIHKKLTGGLGIAVKQGMPDFSESPGSDPAPGETNPLESALDLGYGNSEVVEMLQKHPEAYADLPQHHKDKIKQVLQAKYLLGTPEESGNVQSLAVLHEINLADEGGEADVFDKPFGAEPSPALAKLLEHAKPKEQGGKWALAKTKLPLYQELTDEELAGLTPEQKDLLSKDLSDMVVKFKDPKKIVAVATIQNKISKAHGGGAGAGGTTHVETPAKTEIDAGTKIIAGMGVDLMQLTVKKITGAELSESMKAAVVDKIAGMLASGDDTKLKQAVQGPAAALANKVALNNVLLEPHKGDIHQALADDLFHLLKHDYQPTPVLDAVNKWGKTQALKANAAAKIVAALKDHPSLSGVEHPNGVTDTVLGNELAKHAGETGLPPVFDPSDYEAVSTWLGAHALGNSFSEAKLDGDHLFDADGDTLTLIGEAEKKVKADYLQALFDGKTAPGGLAAELPKIAETVNAEVAAQKAKSDWTAGSPALKAWKAGVYYAELKKAMEGHPAGEGGASTSAPAQVKQAVAESVASPGTLTDGQKISLKQAYKSFGSTAYLKEATVEQNFDNLLAVASAYSGEEGMGQLTFGKVMDAIDEQMATELGVVNGQLLRKKITDWLQTPGGKKYADTASPKGQLLTQLTGKIAEQKEIAEWQKKNALPKYPGPGAFDPAKPSTAFKGHTLATSKKLHDDTLKKLGKTITPAQKQALVSYTGSGASYMNDWLRTGKSYGGINTIKQAHLVAEAMYPIQEDMKLKRRTGWEFVPPQYRSFEAIQKLVGGTFHDPAFMSTTMFDQPGSYGSGLPVELHIEAPKGTQGFHVDHWSNYKGVENEFILGAGQTMQIVGVKKVGHKVVIDVRVVTE